MATVKIRHIKNPQALQAILTSTYGAVAKDLFRRGKKVESQAKKNLERPPRRVDTGLLRSSIHTTLHSVVGKPVVQVGTNVYYAVYVHDGTGIYGPHGVLIRPISAKFLSWENKKGERIFVKTVKGMQPNPFLADALAAAKD